MARTAVPPRGRAGMGSGARLSVVSPFEVPPRLVAESGLNVVSGGLELARTSLYKLIVHVCPLWVR